MEHLSAAVEMGDHVDLVVRLEVLHKDLCELRAAVGDVSTVTEGTQALT